MSLFRIHGPARLSGRFRPAGNKNAALPILAACLLTDEPVVLTNVPDIADVRTLADLMRTLGAAVDWEGPNTVRVHARDLEAGRAERVDPELAARIRASILLASPLLARLGAVELPPPGGDVIGRRRLDTHFLALGRLGAEVEAGPQAYFMRARKLMGADIFLDEPSVTATENAILAAVTARGPTRLRNAATEPHVQDLCRFLVALGARIDGIGMHELRIEGVERLGGGEWRVSPDHIEIGSLVGLAAITGSALTIEDAPGPLDPLRVGFERLGIHVESRGGELFVPDDQRLEIESDLGDQIPKLDDGPWPAFPADLISIALVVATQCRGTILVHEKMFESRMFFVDKVISLGARIVLCDPHRAVVVGPSRLRGGVVESPDIRAGMALLIAALAADGTSEIHNIGQIERGYERIHERLAALGADIERLD